MSDEALAAMPAAALADRLDELCALMERTEVELARVAGAWDARGAWAEEGDAVPAAWFVRRRRWARARARRVVACGRLARRHAAIGQALADGSVSLGHLEWLTRAGTQGRAELLDEHLETLLTAAAGLTVDEFGVVVRRWISYADDVLDRHHDPHDRRHCSLGRGLDGSWHGRFHLDADDGAIVAEALSQLTRPDPERVVGPRRTPTQLRADALVEMARRSMAAGDRAPDATHTVDLLLSPDLLDGHAVADPTTSRCDVDGEPVRRATAERHLCTDWLRRVVFDGRGEVLDLGRRVRLFSPAQRHAMTVRDGGCVWPGCDRPPNWCDAHHLVPFEHDGLTDLADGALLCRHHHRLTHEGGWRLSWVGAPGGRVWSAEPPNRHRRASRAGPLRLSG